MLNPDLSRRLLELLEKDEAKRLELVERGELWNRGYHPEMEAVHRRNARVLEEILDGHAWPARQQVGDEGAKAAWMVAVHAISEPAFQRRCRELLGRAVARGEASAAHLANLVDRIRFNERRPQVYGTIFDWDSEGVLSPWPIEDPQGVTARREAAGLPDLESTIRRAREAAERQGEAPRHDFAQRQGEILRWARRVGWTRAS
ncbi:MAG: DUF6624 domain-containing protein [Acidobacteriota bacterium]